MLFMGKPAVFKKYFCLICGYIYDEEIGDSDGGIPAGTKWHDIPETWICPECDMGKRDFMMIEF